MGIKFGNPAASAKEMGFEIEASETTELPPTQRAEDTTELSVFQKANKRLAESYQSEFLEAEDSIEKAQQFFKKNTLLAAKAILEIVQNTTNDRTRLSAAQYIVDRGLGPVAKADSPENELEKMVRDMQNLNQANLDAKNPAKSGESAEPAEPADFLEAAETYSDPESEAE